jgi:transcriptional regulator with XRE-family HTH domain
MDAKELFGWNLRKNRVARSITQEALSFEVRIDRAYLGRIERGKENITINVIERIAIALETPLNELFRPPTDGESMPKPLKAGRRSGK